MSVNMCISASQNQATSASGMCKQQVQSYQQLQKALNDFTLNSPFLTGKAYDSGKAYFSAVLYPLAQGGILLSEAVERAVKKLPAEYLNQVDSGDLKQLELEEKIRQANQLLMQAETIRQQLISSAIPMGMKTIQLRMNEGALELYSQIKRRLEEKLEKLLTFNAYSVKIFAEIADLQQAVNTGLAQTKTAWSPLTKAFTIPSNEQLSWKKSITDSWQKRQEKEQARLKELLENEELPTSKADIARDYHWSTNWNMYASNKTGKPSQEVTSLYNKLIQAEHAPKKHPQLAFFNEMLRTGRHPITGEKITKAERFNAQLMIYSLALQPFVGAWAISKVPEGYEPNIGKVGVSEKGSELNIGLDAKSHLIDSKGFVRKGGQGVKGGHKMDAFYGELNAQGFSIEDCIINKKPHPTIKGIYEIEYQVPAVDTLGNILPNQYKKIGQPKTVYDSNYFSDDYFYTLGLEAMQNGKINGREIFGSASNGLEFRGFIDAKTGIITNFFPKFPK